MADNDRNRGYRDSEASRRQQPQSAQPSASDPLAELARLIGQQNEGQPSFRKPAAPAAPTRPPAPTRSWQKPGAAAQPDPAAKKSGIPQWALSPADEPAPDGRHVDSRYIDPRFATNNPPSDNRYAAYQPPQVEAPRPNTAYSDGRHADDGYENDGYVTPRSNDPRYVDSRYVETPYADSQYPDPAHDDGAARGFADRRYAAPDPGRRDYDPSSYQHAHGDYAQPAADPRYAAYDYPEDQQYYDDPRYAAPPPPPPPLPRAIAAGEGQGRDGRGSSGKRRRNLVTVLAVLALAVVGTASAFGFRAMFGGAGAPATPPIIKADTQPAKVVPATDPKNKPIQDRIGVKTERVVPRQEEPVQQAAPGQPRTIAPWLTGQNPQGFPPASANIAPSGSTGSAGAPVATEPKRVRTVPIKPQGSETPGPRSSRTPPATQSQDRSVDDDSQAPLALAPTGSVPTPQRQATRHASLAPQGTTGATSPFPTPLPAHTNANPTNAPFAVQVTSQRSEADAQSSYRSLQQQFPTVLGNRNPVIRRADLGDRGTYYRAQIPFTSQTEASEFCTSLKSAGGQCVIARN